MLHFSLCLNLALNLRYCGAHHYPSLPYLLIKLIFILQQPMYSTLVGKIAHGLLPIRVFQFVLLINCTNIHFWIFWTKGSIKVTQIAKQLKKKHVKSNYRLGFKSWSWSSRDNSYNSEIVKTGCWRLCTL